jgi:TolB-like protein
MNFHNEGEHRNVRHFLTILFLGAVLQAAEPTSVDFSSVPADSTGLAPGKSANRTDPAWAAVRPSVAVFDLQEDQYSAKEALRISESLRSRLAASGHFQVVDRSRTSTLTDPHFGDISHCSELDCAWRATKLLHADFVMVGSVERVGKIFYVKISVVDEENGEVVQKLEYQSDLDAMLGTWIPNAVARMAIFSPSALGYGVETASDGRPVSPARQLRDKTEEYAFTKHSALFLDIAGTVVLGLGNVLVSSENQDCRDRSVDNYPYTASTNCGDVRMTRGSIVFAAGAVIQVLGLARTVETFFTGRELKQMEDAAGRPSISLSPFYEPRSRATGILARLEF